MAIATLHISPEALTLSRTYGAVGDVLYLSAGSDDKHTPAQRTPEGHEVRLDIDGRVTHVTVVNASWLLERDGGSRARSETNDGCGCG